MYSAGSTEVSLGEFTIGRFYTVYRPLKPGEVIIAQPFAAHKAITN